ncbi:hypothetical protein SH668x_001599 [Planctomicrobium sp. SH668]|uniref:hypothetical protein n=1 Tax=Planctomicrobium sp. SH668 TaxID=3448126 RepID=UPI003F5C7CF6
MRLVVMGLIFAFGICSVEIRAEEPGEAPVSAEVTAATEAIRALGGNVIPLAVSDPRLDVTLNLASKPVTDEALTHVAKLPNVAWLNLAGTNITSEGLKSLSGLKTLEKLRLEKTEIGDEGLAHLAGLENLSTLNIYQTKVTDAGVKHLVGLKKLKHLYIWQTGVTDAGAAELKKEIPELTIIGEVKPPQPAPEEPKPE